jgi:excisionase family DNA binding protein
MSALEDRFAYSPTEVGRLIGISPDRARQIIDAGEMAAIRLGPRITRVPKSEIERWLAEHVG